MKVRTRKPLVKIYIFKSSPITTFKQKYNYYSIGLMNDSLRVLKRDSCGNWEMLISYQETDILLKGQR